MEWTVYNFECGDRGAREELLSRLAATHPIAFPDDADSCHGTLVDADGDECSADVAWIADYVYVLVTERVDGLLDDTVSDWRRSVVATFDSETETCTEAVFYRAENGTPVRQAADEGNEGHSGQGLVYRFAMAHQFRFRAYAQDPPAPMLTPLLGAFDAFVGMPWGSELLSAFEADTGVAPTGEGLAFLEDDPALDEGEFYDAAESA